VVSLLINGMSQQPDLRQIKRQVSDRLLHEPGVAGVGTPGGKLTVYLEEDSQAVRGRVEQIVKDLIGDQSPVAFLVAGVFNAQ